MSDRRSVMLGVLTAFALGIAGAFGTASRASADDVGPKLVIEVAGQAKGRVVIQLLPKLAPKTVAQVVALARSGAYDGIIFHRVISGFMAQTGDVKFGHHGGDNTRVGAGGSSLPNVPAEFSSEPFVRGVVGMARFTPPDSGNSQFFIMFTRYPSLDNLYTVFGKVIEGMDVVDKIKKGSGQDGAVYDPDYMSKVTVEE